MSGESGALRDILRRLVRARLTAAVAATSSSSSSTASTMSSSTLSTAVTRESEDLAYGRTQRNFVASLAAYSVRSACLLPRKMFDQSFVRFNVSK